MAALRFALTALLLAGSCEARAGNVEVTSVEITVSDLDRIRRFYIEVLQFAVVAESRDASSRTATLRLGEEILRLVDPNAEGRPIAADMPANDLRFQHIAIVVSDMDAARRRLTDAKVTLVSDGAPTLPRWNYDAAGIRALYFRDPDGHFLELIQFPHAKGEPKWRRRDGRLFLGIDHSAIVVRDLAASRHFYRDVLGLTQLGTSLNHGVEQDRLNGLHDSRVRIAALRGARGPGIELLQYLQPDSARTVADDPLAVDLLHWRINLAVPGREAPALRAIQRDPDGHALSVRAQAPGAPFALMQEALRQHWPRYLMEAAQLGIFMVVTLYLTIAIEHPASPLRRAMPSALRRRMLMGLAIGGTVGVLIYSAWGRQSGAHFNPAVTFARLSLSLIEPWDALFYVLAQFLGGWLGLALAALPVRRAAAHETVNHGVTPPGPRGAGIAFAAEFGISFLILFSLLNASHQPQLKAWVGLIAGLHLWAFISFEAPLSGMSLNPARTLASAILARNYRALWVYLLAPSLAMLLAARLSRPWIDH